MSRDYVLKPFRPDVDLKIDYQKDLNAQQLAAVTAEPGPSLVLAGAGAGKTRTLIYRVAFLLEQGVPLNNILLLTFTNKAAKEMMQRVTDLIGYDLSELWGGTFHSVGNRVLRRHADRLGYARDFTIMDRSDAEDLLGACLGDADIDVKATRFPKADTLADLFSLAINTGRTITDLLARRFEQFASLSEQIAAIQQSYTKRKRENGMMDFDDLLSLWLRLLVEQADIREHYQRRFQFVLVDEYQDTNRLQSDLIDLLGERHHNIMAVGDDSQSIYSWRGANFLNILKFPEHHPNARIFKIETNYRSTPEILTLANAAIAPNVNQYEKELEAVRRQGAKPVLVTCADARLQAAFVAQRALELREEGLDLSRMAVLYRSHFHALELQMELAHRNIPFSVSSGIRFFEQAHVKDIGAYLRLVCNPHDELAFKRITKLLPGIGAKSADKLWKRFLESVPGHLDAEAGPPTAVDGVRDDATTDGEPGEGERETPSAHATAPAALAVRLQALSKGVPKKAVIEWAKLATTVSEIERDPTRKSVPAMIDIVVKATYREHLESRYANAASRLDDLDRLAEFGRQFRTPEQFFTETALLNNVEAEAETRAGDEDERLRLSTIHQAKGLEFDVVFVIMLCNGLFPSKRSLDSQEALEEERRLFYVAITRAKNELYLSYPTVRSLGAYGAEFLQQPSLFLHHISEDLIDTWNLQAPDRFGLDP